ncbi:MAG: hypothetical protein AABZ53_11930 [Planctomycetota bacterium]
MGITIHYSGRARSVEAVGDVFGAAQVYAAAREWMFAIIDDPFGEAADCDSTPELFEAPEREVPIRAMVIRPHAMCEAIRLEFDRLHRMEQAFTKTQFAPFEVHAAVVGLLRAIEPYLESLEVMDESGLWETGDEARARARFAWLGRAIDAFADRLERHDMEEEGKTARPDDGGKSRVRPEDEPCG